MNDISTMDHYWMCSADLLQDAAVAMRSGQRSTSPLPASERLAQRVGSVGIVELSGLLTKAGKVGPFSIGTSTVEVREALDVLANDNDVTHLVVRTESGGGAAFGVRELFEAIRDFPKPSLAYVEDMCASAAFYAIAGADSIVANEAALVGSIGTYSVVRDWSRAFNADGITTHVIRAGTLKGAGTIGTEITAEQLAEAQRTVDSVNELFLQAVSEGRGIPMKRVREIADGRVHIASEALSLGLIDGIADFDGTINKLATLLPGQRYQCSGGKQPMATTIGEIRQACPGASDSFLLSAVEAGLSVDQAKAMFAASKAEQSKAAATVEGIEPVGTRPSGGGDASGYGSATMAYQERLHELVATKFAKHHDPYSAARQYINQHETHLLQALREECRDMQARPFRGEVVRGL